MKRLSILFLLLFPFLATAQIYDPVKWSNHIVDKGDGLYDVVFTAKIDDGWSIYSQYLEGEDGPIPTGFFFDKGDHFEKVGKNEECDYHREKTFDKLFDMELIKYKKKAIFVQEIKVTDPSKAITGYLEFMTCDATKCLPPATVDFRFDISEAIPVKSINYRREDLCKGTQSFTMFISDEKKKTVIDHTDDKEVSSQKEQSQQQAQSSIKKQQAKVKEQKNVVDKKAVTASNAIGQNTATPTKPKKPKLLDPVKWTVDLVNNNNGSYTLNAKAKIQEGWTVYSSLIPEGDGPLPTRIDYDERASLVDVSKISEKSNYVYSGFDKVFGIDVTKFKKEVTFSQTIKPKKNLKVAHGYIEYMACDSSKCIFPDPYEFSLNFEKGAVETKTAAVIPNQGSNLNAGTDLEKMFGLSFAQLNKPIGDCGKKEEKNNSLLRIFILGFFGGLLALLTPCVFPMIPLTVSFFTKGSKNGIMNAILYGGSIFLIYLLLSAPFHFLDAVDPNILNNISTSIWLNIIFFIVFIFFAFSFFGYYELSMPSSLTNKVSSAEGVGGIVGIFFMALTLALVSFSCTGPILGSLLAGSLSSDGGAMQLTAGMGGFGLALALPFGLFAAFPSMLKSLPKSGGWLNSVKVVLGFIELALAFKFLSNADLVKQWGLLKIEPFLIIWILVFIGLGLYLFGKIKFPHDSPLKKLSPLRIGLGVLSFAFVAYLFTGFLYNERSGTYRSLSLLSGLAPPVCYSWVHECKCPQGLDCYKDLDEGMAYAKEVNKPVLLDFTGHACVNCRQMEENVWPKPEVYPYLKNDYVLISLYVDEKLPLPEADQITVQRKVNGSKKLRYTGDRWQLLQSEYFNKNTQPLYVLITPEGDLLANPQPYTPNEVEYGAFLECGLSNFRQKGSLISE